jgi:hypothetical protein
MTITDKNVSTSENLCVNARNQVEHSDGVFIAKVSTFFMNNSS